jgi:hypothetical protein
MNQDQIASALRFILTTAGGLLAARGIGTADSWAGAASNASSWVGAAFSIGSFVWSMVHHSK